MHRGRHAAIKSGQRNHEMPYIKRGQPSVNTQSFVPINIAAQFRQVPHIQNEKQHLRICFVLFASYVQVSSLSCQEPRVWCARDQEDTTISGQWVRHPPAVWNYAPNVADLPELFRTKMSGDGIFWAEGADNMYSYFYLDTKVNPNGPKIYLYVKYYVHLASHVNESFGALTLLHHRSLPISYVHDFQWREAVVEVDPAIIANGESQVSERQTSVRHAL